ncbi:MAG: DUF6519 domain-containing protein [Thermoanaerobaculia bacterium]
MKGDRRGDFSRLTFDPEKHYSSVRMQQGRVQLDADWNEHVDIVAHRLSAQATDLIGPSGAPAGSGGFEILPKAALKFDGKISYLSLGHEGVELFSAAADLNIEIRIKPGKKHAGTLFCRFDRTDADKVPQYSYMLTLGEDGLLRVYRDGEKRPILESTEPIAPELWSRVRLRHNEGTFSLFVDDQEVGQPAVGLADLASRSTGAFFMVGLAHLKRGGVSGFEGFLREIRLSTGNDRELGWWSFYRGGAEVVLDRSGHGNHAVLGGGRDEARPKLVLEDLAVGEGRFYAGGSLCENERAFSLHRQPDLPSNQFPDDQRPGKAYLFYLDVWERSVSPSQDPALLEPALGGADTAMRTQVVAQVKCRPIAVESPEDIGGSVEEWRRLAQKGRDDVRLVVSRENPVGALENRLYRVEIHGESGTQLKWSRDNSSVQLPIQPLEPDAEIVTLSKTGPGDSIPFSSEDWVEVVDERSILNRTATELCKVLDVDEDNLSLTLEGNPGAGVATEEDQRPTILRWDGKADLDGGEAVELDGGIKVSLEGDPRNRHGDYWIFATRSSTGAVDWPAEDHGGSAARPPDGVGHLLSPLAVIRFNEWGFDFRDCRPVFQPLTTGAVSKAGDRMHGPLEIRPDDPLSGDPALTVEGAVSADTLLGSVGSPGAVETFALADAAVTRSKISPDVGTVPAGYSILGGTPTPPPGYEYTGRSLGIPTPAPQWRTAAVLAIGEDLSEIHSAASGDSIYSFAANGRSWRYDAQRETLEERRPMPEPRSRFACAASGGKIYLVGGVDHRGDKVGPTLEYDPSTDEWSWREALPTPRCDLALAESDGKLYALGGLRDFWFFEVVSAKNEVYDPLVDHWTKRRPVPTARYSMNAAGDVGEAGRSVYGFGGRRRWFFRLLGRAVSSINQEYLPAVDRWTTRRERLPAPRAEGGAAVIGEAVLLVGGRSLFGWSADVSSFEPRGAGWKSSTPLPEPVVSPGVASIDGRLIVHAPGRQPGTLEALESTIASTFFVHRKKAAVEGDFVPLLDVPEEPASPDLPDEEDS